MTVTSAELRQRQDAARASAQARHGRHQAETSPSIKQGSTGAPSRRAIGLFRAGQSRPDTRARRSVWDTRTSEPTIGTIRARVKFHFPQAYHSATPDAPAKGRPLLATTLAPPKARGRRAEPARDVVITNPGAVAEAQRHPAMREIMGHTYEVLRSHQRPTIERGHAKGLIPAGAHRSTVATAYKHAALLAAHKAGLIDYEFERMDPSTKAQFRPLERFMRYAHRRVFDHLNQGPMKGKWQPFREEFGELYRQKKHGKLTGVERMRMRPNDKFVKLEEIDLEALSKGIGDIGRTVLETAERPIVRTSLGAVGLGFGIRNQLHRSQNEDAPPVRVRRLRSGRLTKGIGELAGDLARSPLGRRYASKGVEGVLSLGMRSGASGQSSQAPETADLLRRNQMTPGFRTKLRVPKPPGGIPKIGGAHLHLRDAAAAVERHFGVPQIGGASSLMRKMDFGFLLGSPTPIVLANPTLDPKSQLTRAMKPRLRRKMLRLRLNTQRHLRSVLNGGVTRQERWMLGATTATPPLWGSKVEKRLLTEADVRRAAREAVVPTDGQVEAGNYRKGHANICGLNVTIETAKGRVRRGRNRNGTRWKVKMPAHYGYIRRTAGADGDHVDVYLGPHAHEADQHSVYVVDQHHPDTGRFDEHKVLLGFPSKTEAVQTYDAGFSDGRGPQRRKAVHEVSFADFKRWVGDEKNTTAPMQKGIIGSALKFGASQAGRALVGGARRISRASTGTKLAAGVGAGLVAPKAVDYWNNHPKTRVVLGALAGGAAVAAVSRGRAIGAIERNARGIYRTSLRDAVREHARVMGGGAASPHQLAAARQALQGARAVGRRQVEEMRNTAMSGLRRPKLKIAGAAAIGGAAAYRGHHNRRLPLYQLAAPEAPEPPDA